jgi:hypothetical protein
LSLLSKDGWIFIGIDDDNTQFFMDLTTVTGNHDDINVTVISVPDDGSNVFSDFQKFLKEENKDFTVLKYIEQSWGLDLSHNKYALYGLIFKSEDGGTIHSISFPAKSITWKFFRDKKIAEKIALRVSCELDKKRIDEVKAKRSAEIKQKKTPKKNAQIKKMNIETETFKTYDIYEHPIGTIEAVKVGWSWPAFFFTWIWALSKRMFVHGVLACIVYIVLGIIPIETGFSILFSILVSIVFGFSGNDWKRNDLMKKGFEYITTFAGETPEGAIASFIKQNDKGNRMHVGDHKRGS